MEALDTPLISFTLVMDRFRIKYTNKDDINDLFKTIKDKYLLEITETDPIT